MLYLLEFWSRIHHCQLLVNYSVQIQIQFIHHHNYEHILSNGNGKTPTRSKCSLSVGALYKIGITQKHGQTMRLKKTRCGDADRQDRCRQTNRNVGNGIAKHYKYQERSIE